MSTTMWKTFFTDENVHYLAQIEATEELRIYLTDLKHIWTEVISKANAYNRFLVGKFVTKCVCIMYGFVILSNKNVTQCTIKINKIL